MLLPYSALLFQRRRSTFVLFDLLILSYLVYLIFVLILTLNMPPKLRRDAGFTEDDRAILNDVLAYIKQLSTKVTKLESNLKKSKEIIGNQNRVILNQNQTINDLVCQINTTNYRADAHQQYNRQEALRGIHVEGLGDDPVKIIMDVCKVIEDTAPAYKGNKVFIDLQPSDIHRCHFMETDTKKKSICKFTPDYHKK